MLGRALAANRSVGMNVASRLEAEGLVERGTGRDRRSKGLFITPQGENVLADLIDRHERAEARLAACLEPGEDRILLDLLHKIQRGIAAEEADLRRPKVAAARPGRAIQAAEG